MRAAALGLLLLGCGPVLLGEDVRTHDAGTKTHAIEGDAADAAAAAVDSGEENVDAATASARPTVSVSVKAIDCGKCFELEANGSGGQPPYQFEWEDGSLDAKRRVCVENAELALSVVARDAAAARSAEHSIRLEGLADAACPEPPPPTASRPPVLVCLENTSFEGTAVANLGQPEAFDAMPWSACTNPSVSNTPDVINETIPQNIATVPKATDGLTYLALGEGEQVSQPFCSTIDAGASLSLTLDLARIDLAEGIVPETEQVFLEVWGGLAVDCSQRELLWASPALKVGWKNYCITLHPHSFMNQITLRANSDMTLASPAYLIVDNLKPMDTCP
jgi:hypothetical protein